MVAYVDGFCCSKMSHLDETIVINKTFKQIFVDIFYSLFSTKNVENFFCDLLSLYDFS